MFPAIIDPNFIGKHFGAVLVSTEDMGNDLSGIHSPCLADIVRFVRDVSEFAGFRSWFQYLRIHLGHEVFLGGYNWRLLRRWW
jgi:hypothetical protein